MENVGAKVKMKVAQSYPTLYDLWTAAHQTPLSMELSREEHWSGLPFPSLGDLPDPGTEPSSPTLQEDSSPCEPPGVSTRGAKS